MVNGKIQEKSKRIGNLKKQFEVVNMGNGIDSSKTKTTLYEDENN